MGICLARELLPVPSEAFPKPQHQSTVHHPLYSSTEGVVPASEFIFKLMMQFDLLTEHTAL